MLYSESLTTNRKQLFANRDQTPFAPSSLLCFSIPPCQLITAYIIGAVYCHTGSGSPRAGLAYVSKPQIPLSRVHCALSIVFLLSTCIYLGNAQNVPTHAKKYTSYLSTQRNCSACGLSRTRCNLDAAARNRKIQGERHHQRPSTPLRSDTHM